MTIRHLPDHKSEVNFIIPNWNKIVEAGKLYGEPSRKTKRKKRREKAYTDRDNAAKFQARKIRVSFYDSREWKALRYQALKLNDGRCQLCGRTRSDGVKLHVDHIKPRSRHPELQLELGNLQVLCEDCNLGKGNKCVRDWRDCRPTADDMKLAGDT